MKRLLIVLAGLILLIAIVYVIDVFKLTDQTTLSLPPTGSEPPPSSDNTTISLGQNYFLVRLGNDFGTHEYHDFKIVYRHPDTGAETVLLPSVKNALPELKSQFNKTLFKLSFPDGSNKIYFTSGLANTDAPPGLIYAFDLNTRSFSKLQIGSYFMLWASSLSPNGWFIATVDLSQNDLKRQKLILLDLKRDEKRTLITLTGNETLNHCAECSFLGIELKISWLDSNTIRYEVYDSSTITNDTGGNIVHPLIEARTLVI